MKNSGHRLGASGTTAENTLEGYRESSAKPEMRGFRYWEFDIRESSDGTVFVFHDDTIDVGGKQSETSQMPFSEIKRAGSQGGISIPHVRFSLARLPLPWGLGQSIHLGVRWMDGHPLNADGRLP